MPPRPLTSNISSVREGAPPLPQVSHYLVASFFYVVLVTVFFSPAIFRGISLAVGSDALYNFLPYFHSKKVLWDRFVFAGFPMMADPTAMSWYPPAWIFSYLGSWDLFMMAAFISASFFTYGYAYSALRCRFAAFIAGPVF